MDPVTAQVMITLCSDMEFSQWAIEPGCRLIASQAVASQVILSTQAHWRRNRAVRAERLRWLEEKVHVASAQPKLLQTLSK